MTPEPTVLDDAAADATTGSPSEDGGHGLFGGQSSAPVGQADNGSLPLLLLFIAAFIAIGFLQSWWIPGILAGLLVVLFMHELGHFVTARMSGMKVTEFFIGFGPKIWSFQRGETEYGIKGILAGAYVRILGMTNLDDIDPAEEHRTYRAQPYWQRMMTICAGSAVHFIMATLALIVLFASYSYNGFNGPTWDVAQVVPGSTAAALGVQPDDQITSINGDSFANWDEFGDVVSNLEAGPVQVVIDRNGEQLTLDGVLGLRTEDVLMDGFGLGLLLEEPDRGWEAGFVWPGDHADEFGFETGDVIVSAGGVAQPADFELATLLLERNGQATSFEIDRDGEMITLSGDLTLNSAPEFRGFFGIGRRYIEEPDPNLVQSVGRGIKDFGVIAKMNLGGLVDLATGWMTTDEPEPERRAAGFRSGTPVPAPQVEGQDTNRPLSVVGIGRLIAESESADEVLFLFAVVNIFIGIFNLLPVLPVDGGHAALATYERVRGLATGTPYRVDAGKLIPLTWVVIVLLVGVGVWTLALDIFSWPA